MEKTLGILGGMGPMASMLFYKMITEHTQAEKDQDHIKTVLLSDSKMPDRTSAILSGTYGPCDEQILRDALFLKDAGCHMIAVTCNTAHLFVDRIKDRVSIPFIHMIGETAAEMALRYPGGTIGIMATDGTIKTGLYQKRLEALGLKPFTPSDKIQKLVMHEIYDCIKAGKRYDEASFSLIEKEFREAGCDSVLLACTELSVIKADENLGDWYTDPMLVMARKCIEACGKTYI